MRYRSIAALISCSVICVFPIFFPFLPSNRPIYLPFFIQLC
nr:MAG TPA: hypothetical protein [Caudoviricetes sp.]